jgi:predicted nucleic acid-binding Zn ribbon protein
MPIYVLRCSKCNKTKEIVCKYTSLKANLEDPWPCDECDGNFTLAPSSCGFTINGFSAENGYHRPEFSSVTGQDASWD